ncbi:MAG: ATP-binding protein [Alphaproteobacteria bacterium]
MTGSDLPILVVLTLVTAYFLYKRHPMMFRDRGYTLIGIGLVFLTLTMLADWLLFGIDHVLPVEFDPEISTTIIAYVGYVPGLLAIGAGLALLLPRIDRLADEIAARRHAEAAAEQRARDLQIAKHQAETANAAKSKFLASMSHELRTPLNAIIGFAEVMREQSFGPLGHARYHGYAGDIEHSGRHLLAIINDILDMSKIEAGAERLNDDVVELGLVIDTATRLVAAEYHRLGIELHVDRHLASCDVKLDQVKVARVLINLLSNAMKFTEAGGDVSLRTRLTADGTLELSVADTGIGMSRDEIDTALTPFGQASAIVGRNHDGTGLGLPIAKALIELHGGHFAIASTPGTGTTVTFTMPAERVIQSTTPAYMAAGED